MALVVVVVGVIGGAFRCRTEKGVGCTAGAGVVLYTT